MPNKIIKNDKVISVRIDDVYTTNEKHLITPYIRPEDRRESYFGSFKFLHPQEARATLKDAVKLLGAEDTIFGGQYPRWINDDWGHSLRVGNRVRFYQEIGSATLVPDSQIRDNIFSLELSLSKTKSNGIYLRVERAIRTGDREPRKYNDSLYSTEDSPF
jgi:hypothetical protein